MTLMLFQRISRNSEGMLWDSTCFQWRSLRLVWKLLVVFLLSLIAQCLVFKCPPPAALQSICVKKTNKKKPSDIIAVLFLMLYLWVWLKCNILMKGGGVGVGLHFYEVFIPACAPSRGTPAWIPAWHRGEALSTWGDLSWNTTRPGSLPPCPDWEFQPERCRVWAAPPHIAPLEMSGTPQSVDFSKLSSLPATAIPVK